MAGDVGEALNTFGAYIEPRDGLGDNPFKLACSFDEPASAAEIAAAWPGGEVPEELVQAWSTSRQSRLFEDVDYGQWGLVLLSPEGAAQRTDQERAQRAGAYRADDVVIGEFFADQELVVLAPSEADHRVLIALPMDDRPDRPVAAGSLAEFLDRRDVRLHVRAHAGLSVRIDRDSFQRARQAGSCGARAVPGQSRASLRSGNGPVGLPRALAIDLSARARLADAPPCQPASRRNRDGRKPVSECGGLQRVPA
jgi:hypothetical protein